MCPVLVPDRWPTDCRETAHVRACVALSPTCLLIHSFMMGTSRATGDFQFSLRRLGLYNASHITPTQQILHISAR